MKMLIGIVQSVVEGVIKRFTATVRSTELIKDREFWDHYGMTSRPLPGAELFIVTQGNVVHAIASDDRRYRVALEDGEVCLYTDENLQGSGHKIHFKRGRILDIKCDMKNVDIDTDETRNIGNDYTKTVTRNEKKTVLGKVDSSITGDETKIILGGHTKNVSGNISEIAAGTLLIKGATVTIQDTAGNQVKISSAETSIASSSKAKVTAPVIEVAGAVTMTGNVAIVGSLSVTGNITSGGQITDSDGDVHSH